MNKKLEALHALNIVSFFIVIAFIYKWRIMALMNVMLSLEILVFVLGLLFSIKLRQYGDDGEQRRLFQKSRWYTLFSLLFICLYFFIRYQLSVVK